MAGQVTRGCQRVGTRILQSSYTTHMISGRAAAWSWGLDWSGAPSTATPAYENGNICGDCRHRRRCPPLCCNPPLCVKQCRGAAVSITCWHSLEMLVPWALQGTDGAHVPGCTASHTCSPCTSAVGPLARAFQVQGVVVCALRSTQKYRRANTPNNATPDDSPPAPPHHCSLPPPWHPLPCRR